MCIKIGIDTLKIGTYVGIFFAATSPLCTCLNFIFALTIIIFFCFVLAIVRTMQFEYGSKKAIAI